MMIIIYFNLQLSLLLFYLFFLADTGKIDLFHNGGILI